jgi:hypothetical protein
MEKYVVVTFSNGDVYRIPASVIADSRASSYAVLSAMKYDEEYEHTLNDNVELIDWAENNMDWSDVESVAELVMSNDVNFEDEWRNADKEIVIE